MQLPVSSWGRKKDRKKNAEAWIFSGSPTAGRRAYEFLSFFILSFSLGCSMSWVCHARRHRGGMRLAWGFNSRSTLASHATQAHKIHTVPSPPCSRGGRHHGPGQVTPRSLGPGRALCMAAAGGGVVTRAQGKLDEQYVPPAHKGLCLPGVIPDIWAIILSC